MSERLTQEQILLRAGHALDKVDRHGFRGITMVTYEEVEALVAVAALAGVVPVDTGTHHTHRKGEKT